MPGRLRSPKERIARALCRLDGHLESITMDGVAMWQSYEDDAVVVLAAIESRHCSRCSKKLNSTKRCPWTSRTRLIGRR